MTPTSQTIPEKRLIVLKRTNLEKKNVKIIFTTILCGFSYLLKEQELSIS
jgi:hypothetical protein